MAAVFGKLFRTGKEEIEQKETKEERKRGWVSGEHRPSIPTANLLTGPDRKISCDPSSTPEFPFVSIAPFCSIPVN